MCVQIELHAASVCARRTGLGLSPPTAGRSRVQFTTEFVRARNRGPLISSDVRLDVDIVLIDAGGLVVASLRCLFGGPNRRGRAGIHG